ncbi:cleavage and polyadenylation specificity factor subunit 3 [Achlya hypogyna]|uniref:Cleavage and polyadenylation specificity factor subunit 3 n=1 Tax=Achlya hypogyna TaxID=1202772 RepID=A0A1V9YBE6_ACHHY|nr:cleavage and polyadenylation specificity factor subunit 3 [Achlya hypogyna]
MAKRKGDTDVVDERHVMRIMPLGAGNEVGRSCIILKFQGKTIMLDCGVHPGYSGHGSLPFFDSVEAEEIDLLLITHFHIDHVAALPHFTEKTNFKGKIFMTHPTKAVMQMMLRDFLRVSNISVDDQIYDDRDLANCVAKVEIIDFHQEKMFNGIKFTPYNAGHVLGACMFLIEIGGVKVLYTGDYSLENDRHLMAAEIPGVAPDVLIVESTYGVQVHQSVFEREGRFTGQVESVVRRGGRCLIPVFALGRTQELLLILDEHWQQHPDLHNVPIYFASKLAAKALRVYQTYINMMNDRIRKQISISNPFHFEHITNLKSLEDFDDSGPSVVMASPGMLQSGVSRQLFERWCTDKRNACLIPGYVVEGTLAKKILSEPTEITAMDGRLLPMNCSVEYISFSAHADFVGTSGFIEKVVASLPRELTVAPPNIVLVHGEKNEMMRLKSALLKKFHNPKVYAPTIHTPANTQEIVLEFRGEKMAKAIGTMATAITAHQKLKSVDKKIPISGLLVEHDFHTHIMEKDDLAQYTSNLLVGTIAQRQHVPFVHQPFDVLVSMIQQMYEDVTHTKDVVVVSGQVMVTHCPPEKVLIEWSAEPTADMIADSIVALAMHAQASPASFKMSMHPHAACKHDHRPKPLDAVKEEEETKEATPEESPETTVIEDEGLQAAVETLAAEGDLEALQLILVFRVLKDQYGHVDLDHATNVISIHTPSGASARVQYFETEPRARVECENTALFEKLVETLAKLDQALRPIPNDA